MRRVSTGKAVTTRRVSTARSGRTQRGPSTNRGRSIDELSKVATGNVTDSPSTSSSSSSPLLAADGSPPQKLTILFQHVVVDPINELSSPPRTPAADQATTSDAEFQVEVGGGDDEGTTAAAATEREAPDGDDGAVAEGAERDEGGGRDDEPSAQEGSPPAAASDATTHHANSGTSDHHRRASGHHHHHHHHHKKKHSVQHGGASEAAIGAACVPPAGAEASQVPNPQLHDRLSVPHAVGARRQFNTIATSGAADEGRSSSFAADMAAHGMNPGGSGDYVGYVPHALKRYVRLLQAQVKELKQEVEDWQTGKKEVEGFLKVDGGGGAAAELDEDEEALRERARSIREQERCARAVRTLAPAPHAADEAPWIRSVRASVFMRPIRREER